MIKQEPSVSYETPAAPPPPPPTPDQFSAYQAMYDYFNRELFGGQLRAVILNFSRKAHSMGFFAAHRWDNGAERTHEISINPTILKEVPAAEVAATLVHEMCHLWQRDHGHPSRTGYHNTEWADKMEAIGLMPSSTGKPGGKRTGQQMADYPIEGGAFLRAFGAMPKHCRLPWACEPEEEKRRGAGGGGAGGGEEEGEEGEGTPKKKNKVKYSCSGGCSANVWGKPGLSIRCKTCRADFAEIEA